MKTRDDLEEMTKAELKEYAEVQGVTVLVLDSKGTMIDKILGEYQQEEKPKAKDTAKEPPIGALYDLQGNKVNAPLWNLQIFSTSSDDSDVSLIVNGHNILVKRNVTVQVPYPYIEALRNSTIDTVVYDEDTNKSSSRRIQNYPHEASPV